MVEARFYRTKTQGTSQRYVFFGELIETVAFTATLFLGAKGSTRGGKATDKDSTSGMLHSSRLLMLVEADIDMFSGSSWQV